MAAAREKADEVSARNFEEMRDKVMMGSVRTLAILPEDYLKDRIAVLLGGRTAEKELLGTVSSGADDDIRNATALARAMVSRWGMSDKIGPVDLRDSEEHPFLGREIAQPRRFSETTAHWVDEAVGIILHEAEARDAGLVHKHRVYLDRLVATLEKEETLNADQIDACLGPGNQRAAPARNDAGDANASKTGTD